MKRSIILKTVAFILLLVILGCATPQQYRQATEGFGFETGKDRSVVIEAIVQVLTNEGFVIDNINEKYGLINCKPNTILTGELMKKLGEPGGSWISTNAHMVHTIEFSGIVSPQGQVRIKVTASQIKEENIGSVLLMRSNATKSLSIDVYRTIKLNNYFAGKIRCQLGIRQGVRMD